MALCEVMGVDELRLWYVMTGSNRVMAVCLAVAASLALFTVLTAGGGTVRAQIDASPTAVESWAGCGVGDGDP